MSLTGFYPPPIRNLVNEAGEDANPFQPAPSKKRKGNTLNSPTNKPEVQPVILQINPRPTQLMLARTIRATFPNVNVLQCRELRSIDEIFIQPGDAVSRSTICNVTNLHYMFPNSKITIRSPMQKKKEAPSYVITNVSFDYTLEDIKTELTNCNLPPKDVARIVSRATNKPTKLVRVFTSHPNHVVTAVKNGVFLGFQRHRCEESNRKPNVIQCFKCQGYGHVSKECPNTLKCLRCSGDHTVKDCQTPKEEPVCANCSEKHASIYKGCRIYQTEVNKVVEKQQQRKSYANVTANTITNSIQVKDVVVFVADLLQKLRSILQTMSGSDVIAAVSNCATLHFSSPISGEVIYNQIELLNKPTIPTIPSTS